MPGIFLARMWRRASRWISLAIPLGLLDAGQVVVACVQPDVFS
jgi:hypothetical protein